VARHLLVTNDYPPKTGGIQVYLHELWSRLEPGRAVVLTARSHPDADAFDARGDIVIERVATRTLFWPTPRTRRAIEEAIARHDPALVLLDPAWPLGLIGPFLSRPFGVIVHGAEVTIPGRLPLLSASLRFVLARARVMVSAGGYPEAEARHTAGSRLGPVIQIPPGVDTERFVPLSGSERAAVREELSLSSADPLIVAFSRLVPRKGMDTLIRASAELRAEFPKLVVSIGGAGRDRARLERLAHSLSAPVEFLGRVADDLLPRWLAAGDLMVMDCRSRWAGFEQEGFGIVFVEAAACGVAQVAGRSGGSHEAVSDQVTGLVVANSRSVEDLARAIRELLVDPARRQRYGAAAREQAVARFDWRALAELLGTSLAPFDGYAT